MIGTTASSEKGGVPVRTPKLLGFSNWKDAMLFSVKPEGEYIRALVTIEEDTADPVIVWLGADDYATELAVDPILEEASKWAVIPQDMRTRLLLDQESEGARPRPRLLFGSRFR